jgi:hypothetical protein
VQNRRPDTRYDSTAQKPADRDQQLRAADRRVRVPSHRPDARCDSTAPRASGQRPAAVRSRQARQSAKPPSSRKVRQHRPKSQRTATSNYAQPTGASECQATVQPHGATAPPQEPADRDQQLRAAYRRVRVSSHRPDARCDSTAPKASGQRPAAVRSLQARQSAKPPSSRTIRQHRPESQRTATALRTMRPGWPKRWFG